MTNTPGSPGYSTTQAAVQIVQNMVQCGMGGDTYEDETNNLHGFMAEFAVNEVRKDFRELDTLSVNDALAYVTDEVRENEPIALAYWAATSTFFRKVYQAAAAAA